MKAGVIPSLPQMTDSIKLVSIKGTDFKMGLNLSPKKCH